VATDKHVVRSGPKKIWIDLDNSPHVPFFVPIINELESRGYSVLVTVRDCFQVCELADLLSLRYRRIGRHYGKNKLLKLAGLVTRALQLAPTILREKPDLALSHGSRAQLLLSTLLRVPSIVAMDYEFARGLVLMKPGWIMIPEPLSESTIELKGRILKYPGIKEDVYVPKFKPDPRIRTDLGLNGDDLVVTVRPPANEAHYHNPESDALFNAVINLLSDQPDTKIVLLPRNQRQELSVRKSWPNLFASGKMMVPTHAVDGLNLIWHSDLVISGGGTMNREAAALGVPVYSIFRGKIGAVDRYLARTGRLVMVENIDEVRTKIKLNRRQQPAKPEGQTSSALRKIVDNVVTVVERNSTAQEYCVQ
jgi:predicted glycosyltransferase